MARVGIFGGTFNPIHKGHISLAKQLGSACQLDRIVLMPTNCPPHKRPPQLADNADRLAMCRLAARGETNIEVSSLEFELGGKSYTVRSLKEYKKRFPQDDLFLLIGSDMIFTFDLWKDYQEILRIATVAAGARREREYEAMREKANALGGNIRVEQVNVFPMSSTQIRLRIAQGLQYGTYLAPAVAQYIQQHHLYLSPDSILAEIRPIAKELLSKKRLYHSECVAAQAKQLAHRFGGDVRRAELAGMLHDIMKNQSDKSLLQMLEDHGIILSKVEQSSPQIWHSIAGAAYCCRELGIADAEIVNAVRYHTTARAGMSLLEKIIYVADCISQDRKYDGVKQQRYLAKQSLDQAMLYSLKYNIARLSLMQKPLHPDTINAYHEMLFAAEDL